MARAVKPFEVADKPARRAGSRWRPVANVVIAGQAERLDAQRVLVECRVGLILGIVRRVADKVAGVDHKIGLMPGNERLHRFPAWLADRIAASVMRIADVEHALHRAVPAFARAVPPVKREMKAASSAVSGRENSRAG